MEPELLAGVDVVRGPVANIYGSGAIGGVVSMRTIDTQDILKPGRDASPPNCTAWSRSNMVQGLGSAFFAARPVDNFDFMVGTTAPPAQRLQGWQRQPRRQQPLPRHHRDRQGQRPSGRWSRAEVRLHQLRGRLRQRPAERGAHRAASTPPRSTTRSRPAAGATTGRTTGCSTSTSTPIGPRTGRSRSRSTAPTARSPARSASRRSFQVETIGVDANNTSRWESGPWRARVHGRRRRLPRPGQCRRPERHRRLLHAQRPAHGLRRVRAAAHQLHALARAHHRRPLRQLRLEGANGVGGSSGDRVSPKATLGITPIQWFTVYGTYAEGYRAPAVTEVFVNGAHPQPAPFTLAAEPRPQAGNRQDQGNRHQHQARRPVRRQRCAAHQGQRLPERRHRLHRADRAGQRSAGAGRSHLHDAAVRLHPVSEHSVGAHPRRGVRRQL